MRRYLAMFMLVLLLTACSSQSLQPAAATDESAINQVAPTAKAAVAEVAPTIRALVPTPAPTTAPDPQFPNTLDKNLIACFAPGCSAEEAFILSDGTPFNDIGQDDGAWRFIQVQGGGQVWVLRAQLTKG